MNKNVDNYTIEQLKFFFYQAEKRLEESNKNFESTTSKTLTLLSIAVSIFSALSTYFFLNNDFNGQFSPKLFTVLTLCVYSFIVVFYLLKNIEPHPYYPMGSMPSDMLFDPPGDPQIEIKQKLFTKDIYFSELENYQERITLNFKSNDRRLKRLNLSLKLFIFLPLVGFFIYLVTYFSVRLGS